MTYIMMTADVGLPDAVYCHTQDIPELYGNLFISIDRMLSLAPTLDNADPLFTVVITSGVYLHNVDVAD